MFGLDGRSVAVVDGRVRLIAGDTDRVAVGGGSHSGRSMRLGGGVIRVHYLRAIRSGRFHHVEAHLVVPEFWSVERAHDVSEDVAARVIRDRNATDRIPNVSAGRIR